MRMKRMGMVLWIAVFSVVCFLGLKQSGMKPFEVTFPYYPWSDLDFAQGQFSLWDHDASVEEMEGTPLYDWKEVYAAAEAYEGDSVFISVEWDVIKEFAEKNIYTFTHPGLTYHWRMGYWDIDFSQGDDYLPHIPGAITIKKLLLDKSREKDRAEVLSRLIAMAKSPELKQLWEQQHTQIIDSNKNYLESDNEFLRIDYEAVSEASYEEALRKGIDYYIKVLDSVKHEDKVMFSKYRNWVIVRIWDDYYEFLMDRSAFNFYSLCYRLGPDGSHKLKGYLEKAKKELG